MLLIYIIIKKLIHDENVNNTKVLHIQKSQAYKCIFG